MRQANPKRVARLSRWLKDPLFAFLLIGAGVFAVESAWRAAQRDAEYTIVVPPAESRRLAELWQAQTGRAPTPSELQGLLEEQVREEILVREAKRLRLGEGDAIVRRRLVQKLAFLADDMTTGEAVDEATLRRYFEDNRERFETPAVVTFSHIYFSPEQRADARADAERALAALDADAWRSAGDPFMLGRTYAYASLERVRKDFGDEFAAVVASRPAEGAWRGPLRSVYGQHLVRVDANTPAHSPDYAAAKQRVVAEFDAERRAAANREYFEELRARYTVETP